MFNSLAIAIIGITTFLGCETTYILNDFPHDVVVTGYFENPVNGVAMKKIYLKYDMRAAGGADVMSTCPSNQDWIAWEQDLEVDATTGEFEVDFTDGIVPNDRVVEFCGTVYEIENAYVVFAQDTGYSSSYSLKLTDAEVDDLNQAFFSDDTSAELPVEIEIAESID